MTKIETKVEMSKEFEKWVNRSDNRRIWYEDKFLVLSDAQIQQMSIISSISAAILAALTVFRNTGGCWTQLSFWLFFINIFLGVVLVCWLLFFNKKVLTADRLEELAIYDRFKTAARKGKDYPSEINRANYWNLGSQIEDEIKNKKPRFVIERAVLETLYVLFLASFLLGTLGLAGVWVSVGDGRC